MHVSTFQTTLKQPVCHDLWKFWELGDFQYMLSHLPAPHKREPPVWSHPTGYWLAHMEETLCTSRWDTHLPPRVWPQGQPQGQGAISSRAAKPPGDYVHTPNSPVRAPPRLPLLSCLPSSLSCLLNLKGFPGPEITSGLLDFRKGIGGGDNMWSSCKEAQEKDTVYMFILPYQNQATTTTKEVSFE